MEPMSTAPTFAASDNEEGGVPRGQSVPLLKLNTLGTVSSYNKIYAQQIPRIAQMLQSNGSVGDDVDADLSADEWMLPIRRHQLSLVMCVIRKELSIQTVVNQIPAILVFLGLLSLDKVVELYTNGEHQEDGGGEETDEDVQVNVDVGEQRASSSSSSSIEPSEGGLDEDDEEHELSHEDIPKNGSFRDTLAAKVAALESERLVILNLSGSKTRILLSRLRPYKMLEALVQRWNSSSASNRGRVIDLSSHLFDRDPATFRHMIHFGVRKRIPLVSAIATLVDIERRYFGFEHAAGTDTLISKALHACLGNGLDASVASNSSISVSFGDSYTLAAFAFMRLFFQFSKSIAVRMCATLDPDKQMLVLSAPDVSIRLSCKAVKFVDSTTTSPIYVDIRAETLTEIHSLLTLGGLPTRKSVRLACILPTSDNAQPLQMHVYTKRRHSMRVLPRSPVHVIDVVPPTPSLTRVVEYEIDGMLHLSDKVFHLCWKSADSGNMSFSRGGSITSQEHVHTFFAKGLTRPTTRLASLGKITICRPACLALIRSCDRLALFTDAQDKLYFTFRNSRNGCEFTIPEDQMGKASSEPKRLAMRRQRVIQAHEEEEIDAEQEDVLDEDE